MKMKTLTAFGHQSLKQTNGGIRDEEAERVLAEGGTDWGMAL